MVEDEFAGLWSQYEHIQRRLRGAESHEIEGLEAQLDLILSAIEARRPLTSPELARAKDTAERRVRRRNALLRQHGDAAYFYSGPPDTERGVDWALALTKTVRLLSRAEIEFLVAEFLSPHGAPGGTPGAKRTRLHRIRRKVAGVSAGGL